MIPRTAAQKLAVCTENHGAPDNSARVYVHAVAKTCIRLAGTRTWVHSPDVSAFDDLGDA